jgi:hypothetical protein
MSQQTKSLLEQFAALANWSTVGLPQDMERFREFIISAYKVGEHNIPLDEFLDILGSNKDTDIDVQQKKRILASKMFMFDTYENGIKLLREFEGI